MATKTQDKDSKFNITYEEKIITSETEFENPLAELPPVFEINNVEVLFSSLSAKTPKMGHSITLVVDDAFVQKDRQVRAYFAQQRQTTDPNCETYRSQIKIISQKDILEGKFKEGMKGKALLNIFTTNAKMFDADGEKGSKSLQKMSDATNGNIVYKYFANTDRFTGKAISPQVYKIVNGEKVTTFLSPKTGKETPLFVGSKDLVNIKVRPYETHSDTHGYALKYNLLEIEIVQTAFDRGLSQYKGGGHKVEKAPDAVSFAGLSSMFAGSVETVATQTKTVETSKKETKVEALKPDIPWEAPVETKEVKTELPKENTSAPAMQFDFSQLGADLGNLN